MFSFYRKAAWTFTSNLPASKVVANIEREIQRGSFRGSISADEVVIELDGMLANRSYQPIFRGKLSVSDDGCTLSGTITYPLSLRLFTEVFLGFSVLWTIGAYFTTRGDEEAWWMPLAGLIFTAVGIGFFKLIEIYTERLKEGLESEIENALARVA